MGYHRHVTVDIYTKVTDILCSRDIVGTDAQWSVWSKVFWGEEASPQIEGCGLAWRALWLITDLTASNLN